MQAQLNVFSLVTTALKIQIRLDNLEQLSWLLPSLVASPLSKTLTCTKYLGAIHIFLIVVSQFEVLTSSQVKESGTPLSS